MDKKTASLFLAEHKWKLYEAEDPGLLPDGRLLRRIDDVAHDDAGVLIGFLEEFVSAKNYETSSAIRYAFVAGPLVDGIARSGNWRHVRSFLRRMDGQGRVVPEGTRWRIVQELAEGFLSELAGADARLIQGRSNTGDTGENPGAEYLTLEWIGVNPDTVKSLADGKLSTSTLSGLTYRKVQHDGSAVTVALGDGWHCLAVNWELAQDGSGTIRLGVAKPEFVLQGFTSWLGSRQTGLTQYFDVPEALAQEIMDAAKARGADCRGNYKGEQGLVDITVSQVDFTGVSLSGVVVSADCDQVTTADFVWGGGNPETGIMIVAGAGNSLYNGNYVATATLVNGKPRYEYDAGAVLCYLEYNGFSWIVGGVSQPGYYYSTSDTDTPDLATGWIAYGLTAPAPTVSRLPVLPIPNPIPAGASYDRNVNENGDGTFSIVLRKRMRKYRALTEYDAEFRADQGTKRKEWKGLTDQDLGTALNAQDGKVVRVRKTFREDCSVDVDRDVITPAAFDTDWFLVGDDKSGQIQMRMASGQTLAAAKTIADSAPASGSWFTRGNVSGPDAFGKYSATAFANAAPASYSSSVPYKSYDFSASGGKRQFRQDPNDAEKTQYRVIDLTYYYAGNTNENTVKSYVEGSDREGVKITPNGRGEYFQGTSYKINSVGAWTDES